jgi:hypothetical protein
MNEVNMPLRHALTAAACALLVLQPVAQGQSNFPPEEFQAIAIVNNELGSGAGRVDIRVTRWSSDSERDQLVNALVSKGPDELLKQLIKAKPVGYIKTPDSLGYDLHFATQRPGADGGRDIVIATDRPIGFWEASNRPRTIDYPFTVIQMQMGKDGKGKGTMSYATKIRVIDRTLELENFSTAPVMLTEIEARPSR